MTKSKKTIQVRKAEPKDIVNISKLLINGWNEQTVEYAPINDVRGYAWILGILDEGFIAVADLNGRIVGAVAASPYRPPWSLKWLVDVEFLYILPQFRQADIARLLISASEGFADEHGAAMTFGIQSGSRVLAKDRMMKQAGWEYVGGNFLRPSNGQEQENNKD